MKDQDFLWPVFWFSAKERVKKETRPSVSHFQQTHSARQTDLKGKPYQAGFRNTNGKPKNTFARRLHPATFTTSDSRFLVQSAYPQASNLLQENEIFGPDKQKKLKIVQR